VLLGDKSGLGKELKSEMTVAGVIHIAVLSGSNIALVAAIIFGLTKMLSYNLRIILSVTVVLLFVMLSGAEPPALRAGILVVIIFLGKFLHRELHVGRGLLLAAFIMVFINPFSLIYDMSFQLSFLATIGIVYVAPWVEKFCGKITQRFGLREVVAGTLGAQIAVTPLLMYSTGAFSIVSLPANVLIVWAVPMLMALGFFGGALHAVSIYLALPIAFLGELISGYIIFITKLFAHMSYAQILF
jgi:competence protein ComEC